MPDLKQIGYAEVYKVLYSLKNGSIFYLLDFFFFLTFKRAVTVAASIFLGVPPVFSFYIILM